MALLSDVASRLSSQGLVPAGYSVMQGVMPASPDSVIALFETGGSGPSLAFGAVGLEAPALQIRVRGSRDDYNTPRAALDAIYRAATGWGAYVVGATRYVSWTPLQAPFLIDRDSNGRIEVGVNFLVERDL